MTVGDLKAMLSNYPDDMEVTTSRCSDQVVVEVDDWYVSTVVPQQGGAYMRPVGDASDSAHAITDKRIAPRQVLHLTGN